MDHDVCCLCGGMGRVGANDAQLVFFRLFCFFVCFFFFRQLIRSPAAFWSMLCVMHAQLPCHIKWRVKLELAGKENTKKKS